MPKLNDLISEPEDYFSEEKITGKDVPVLWKAYLAGGTERLVKMIMKHCLSDVLKEIILTQRNFLIFRSIPYKFCCSPIF